MILWRVSRHLDLTGRGGVTFAGRWHHAGHAVVYLAESPAGALLEACVHTSAGDIPPSFTLLRVAAPALPIDQVDAATLAGDWPQRTDLTRDRGTEWLRARTSTLLRVPSALVPETLNYLLNPSHSDAGQFQIEKSWTYPFDVRLKH
jgi:RES domain-containing protein